MARKRQLVVFALPDLEGDAGEETRVPGMPEPLGKVSEVLEAFARRNTAPDGGPGGSMGTTTLYGPGLIAEFANSDAREPLQQVMVTVVEEDTAWPVLSKLCRETGWKLQDVESGLTFG